MTPDQINDRRARADIIRQYRWVRVTGSNDVRRLRRSSSFDRVLRPEASVGEMPVHAVEQTRNLAAFIPISLVWTPVGRVELNHPVHRN